MTRAERRHYAEKAKAKAKHKLMQSFSLTKHLPTPRQIGRAATMHNTCPCWMCTEKHPPTNRYKSGYPAIYGEAYEHVSRRTEQI